jgi:hypothetical protein
MVSSDKMYEGLVDESDWYEVKKNIFSDFENVYSI